MTKIELKAAIQVAETARASAWAAFRATEEKNTCGVEYQAFNAANRVLSNLHSTVPVETQARINAGSRVLDAGRAADRRDSADMY